MAARGLVGITCLSSPTVKKVMVLEQSSPGNTQFGFLPVNHFPGRIWAYLEVLPVPHPHYDNARKHVFHIPWEKNEAVNAVRFKWNL